jgi:hypothetical protein
MDTGVLIENGKYDEVLVSCFCARSLDLVVCNVPNIGADRVSVRITQRSLNIYHDLFKPSSHACLHTHLIRTTIWSRPVKNKTHPEAQAARQPSMRIQGGAKGHTTGIAERM